VAVLIEREEPLLAHEVHGLLGVRERVLDADAVVLLDLVEERVRLRVQPASVEREDAVLAARQVRVLDERNVLCT
jgi:hypothetical protein